MVAIIQRVQRTAVLAVTRFERAVVLLRKNSGRFDHLCRAIGRYEDVLGGRLAAAIAYYGFFAAFALSLIAFGVLLRAVPSIESTLIDFLTEHFPELPLKSFQESTTSLTIFGGIGLVLAGIGWVDAWRSSQRAVWLLDQHPGNPFFRRIVDLGMLLGLAIITGGSLVLADLLTSLFDWISGGATSIWLAIATNGTTILVNIAFAIALLTVLPRLHISPRRLLPAATIVGLGISGLNWVGRIYVDRTTANPAYAVVATAAGLLVYLYLYNQLVLFGAAIVATSTTGRFIDLAVGSRQDLPDEPQHAEVDSDARARRAEKIRAAAVKGRKPRSH